MFVCFHVANPGKDGSRFSGKKNLIFGFPVISSLMLKKNFIENGRKMTKLEAFFERPSLIEQPNMIQKVYKVFLRNIKVFIKSGEN